MLHKMTQLAGVLLIAAAATLLTPTTSEAAVFRGGARGYRGGYSARYYARPSYGAYRGYYRPNYYGAYRPYAYGAYSPYYPTYPYAYSPYVYRYYP